uniref:Uncharacterized protein n=1 Tax=Solanum lycopersicum TaxID=4081 RepID=A0A3Q7FI16_SOLLC
MAYIVEFCHVNVYNVILRMSTMLFINPTICSTTTELAKLIMFKGPVMHENIDWNVKVQQRIKQLASDWRACFAELVTLFAMKHPTNGTGLESLRYLVVIHALQQLATPCSEHQLKKVKLVVHYAAHVIAWPPRITGAKSCLQKSTHCISLVSGSKKIALKLAANSRGSIITGEFKDTKQRFLFARIFWHTIVNNKTMVGRSSHTTQCTNLTAQSF